MAGLGLGLLKNKLPKVIWWSMYFSGPSRTKSPGLIFKPKPAEVKGNSADFARASNRGIGLLIGAGNTGRALTRDAILNGVWGYDCFVNSRTVDRFVTTLRNKIEPNPHRPRYIHTIRAVGYKFEMPHEPD